MTVIAARGLRKAYGATQALGGVDLHLERGEVLALLGPNGAGKTTAVEILQGNRTRDGGQVTVLGEDPETAGRSWRARIGVVLQSGGFEDRLRVGEYVGRFARFYPRPRPPDEVVELVGLTGQRAQSVRHLSGGQRRRLDLALALVGNPELLFLDEPTTGFDPAARLAAWEVVEELRGSGLSVLLTTHYLEEAQRLADRIAVLHEGRVVAEGPPGQIGGRDDAPATVTVDLPSGFATADLPDAVTAGTELLAVNGTRVVLASRHTTDLLYELTRWARDAGCELRGLTVERPTLESVYLALTDSAAAEEGPPMTRPRAAGGQHAATGRGHR